MTTFVRSRRNDNVLIGFAVLVLAGMAVSVAIAGNTVAAAILALLSLGAVGVAVWLNRRPSRELRVSPTEIVYVASGRTTARIGYAEAGGRVRVDKRIHQGHAWFSLVGAEGTAGAGIPLDGFRLAPGDLDAACTEHGWQLVS